MSKFHLKWARGSVSNFTNKIPYLILMIHTRQGRRRRRRHPLFWPAITRDHDQEILASQNFDST